MQAVDRQERCLGGEKDAHSSVGLALSCSVGRLLRHDVDSHVLGTWRLARSLLDASQLATDRSRSPVGVLNIQSRCLKSQAVLS